MKLPEDLAAALAAAGEEYLIGLCNKGTVNRAKKDLAALPPPDVQVKEEGAEVRMGEITCLIRAPLGESRCSCPSTGICRHRKSSRVPNGASCPQTVTVRSRFSPGVKCRFS